ncbi:MAG: DUF2267 domain-containing protein [Cyclobacteriaceae bacterium]
MYFEKYSQEGQQILQTLAEELGSPGNTDRAGRTLKSVLYALRNRYTLEKSLEFLDALPFSLKAVYVDHWSLPRHQPEPIQDLDDLISEARKVDKDSSIQDFTTHDEAQQAIYAVFRVIGRYMGEEEVRHMVAVLP